MHGLGILGKLSRAPAIYVLHWSSQAHGYATHEFEVTVERLGCYLPVSTRPKLISHVAH